MGTQEYCDKLDRLESLELISKLDRNIFSDANLIEDATGLSNLENFCDVYVGGLWRLNKSVQSIYGLSLKNPEWFKRFREIIEFTKLAGRLKPRLTWMYKVVAEKQNNGPNYTYFRRIRGVQAKILEEEKSGRRASVIELPEWKPIHIDDGQSQFKITKEEQARKNNKVLDVQNALL